MPSKRAKPRKNPGMAYCESMARFLGQTVYGCEAYCEGMARFLGQPVVGCPSSMEPPQRSSPDAG